MEELVKMLIDQRAIETNDEKWLVNPEKLLSADVPPTLTGILQARLDGLPARERIALQKASVIGVDILGQGLGRARCARNRGIAGAGPKGVDAEARCRDCGRCARICFQTPYPASGYL